MMNPEERNPFPQELLPRPFGKYSLLEKIGEGNLTQLYKGQISPAQGFAHHLAIKILLPDFYGEKEVVNTFIEEAKLAALLIHRNIAMIHDFGLMENSYFIASEFIGGRDLRYFLNKSRERRIPLTLENALYIASQIFSGLHYACRLTNPQGEPLHIVHGEIRPENIMITYGGEVKIVDFGLAQAAAVSAGSHGRSSDDRIAYRSPEQARGDKTDHRSDIFSAGVLLYEMIVPQGMVAGPPPLPTGGQPGEFVWPEKALSGLTPKLQKMLNKMLAQEIGQRYPSWEEVLEEFREVLSELSPQPNIQGFTDYTQKLLREERESVQLNEAPPELLNPEETFTEDINFLEKILDGARETMEGEPASRKNRLLYYTALVIVLGTIGLVWGFWSKGKTENLPANRVNSAASANSVAEATLLQKEASGLIEKSPQKAIPLLLKTIQLDPQSVPGHFQLGVCFMKLQDFPRAIEAYQKVIGLDPKLADAYFNLGYIYGVQQNFPRAEEMYQRVVELRPAYLDEAFFNLGWVQEKQGKRKQGIENLERALQVNSKNEMAQKLLSKLREGS